MENNQHSLYTVEIKKLPNSRIEIKTSIGAEEFDATRNEAIKHIGADVELPGFRKGHVPEKVLLSKIGEAALLEEMAEIAIGKSYPAIVVQEKIDVLGRPEIGITKIAHGNPLEFTITTAVFPEYKLPDYKKIAAKSSKKKDEIKVTDEDMEKTINQIKRMRAQSIAESEGKEFDESAALPELDDEYIATLGAGKTLEEFKNTLKENMLLEKTRTAKDKKRIEIMEAIAGETKIELPEIIIEQELLRMEDEFAADVARMGLDIEGYLKSVEKTKEDLKKDWRPDAIKRATIQILIGKIADEEKLEPDPVKLEQDVKALRERYPEAEKGRIHSYVVMLLTNERVFEFLEAQEA